MKYFRNYFILMVWLCVAACNRPKESTLLVTEESKNLADAKYDSTYLVGDFKFIAKSGMAVDLIIHGQPHSVSKSKGDTLYNDKTVTLLGDYQKLSGHEVYKRYIPAYSFEDFKMTEIFNGPFKKPDFNGHGLDSLAKFWMKETSNSAKINFAGHYQMVQWGCGTECINIAVIDRRSGEVFSTNQLRGNFESKFQKASRLIIMNGVLLDVEHGYYPCSSRFPLDVYEWNGKQFLHKYTYPQYSFECKACHCCDDK